MAGVAVLNGAHTQSDVREAILSIWLAASSRASNPWKRVWAPALLPAWSWGQLTVPFTIPVSVSTFNSWKWQSTWSVLFSLTDFTSFGGLVTLSAPVSLSTSTSPVWLTTWLVLVSLTLVQFSLPTSKALRLTPGAGSVPLAFFSCFTCFSSFLKTTHVLPWMPFPFFAGLLANTDFLWWPFLLLFWDGNLHSWEDFPALEGCTKLRGDCRLLSGLGMPPIFGEKLPGLCLDDVSGSVCSSEKENKVAWCFSSDKNVSESKTRSVYLKIDRLVGLVVEAFASGAEDPGFESHLRRDFSGSSHTSDLEIGTPVATLQAPGIIGSALGLVGPVSVYCDWVR